MKLYISPRQHGKTTMLVKKSAETGAIIVTANNQMAKHVELIANELGLDIPKPISVRKYIIDLAGGGLNNTQKYLIDELQMMLYQMNVEMATVNIDVVDILHDYHLKENE